MKETREVDESLLLQASLAELEHQRAAVLQLNQLKNDLIAVLAHDIKGPLTSIVGFAELLEEGYLEGEAAVDAARTIRTNAQRLAILANDVLALSRIEHGELEIADQRVDLVSVIEQSIESIGPDREVRFTSKADAAFIRGDAERLRQVFENLLRNAVKYSKDTPIDVSVEREGDTALVARVRDYGIGIPPEDLPKLFMRFARGSNAKRSKVPGTGLGLFIVRMLVERHGGSVAVESAPDQGSTFIVILPTWDAASNSNPMRVAVVAVDAQLRLFCAYELRSRGYRVHEYASIAEAAAGDIRDGDIVVLGPYAGAPSQLRAALAPGRQIRLVGVEKVQSQCDAVIARPFLAADLLAAVSGEPRETFLNTGANTLHAPTDVPPDGTARIP